MRISRYAERQSAILHNAEVLAGHLSEAERGQADQVPSLQRIVTAANLLSENTARGISARGCLDPRSADLALLQYVRLDEATPRGPAHSRESARLVRRHQRPQLIVPTTSRRQLALPLYHDMERSVPGSCALLVSRLSCCPVSFSRAAPAMALGPASPSRHSDRRAKFRL